MLHLHSSFHHSLFYKKNSIVIFVDILTYLDNRKFLDLLCNDTKYHLKKYIYFPHLVLFENFLKWRRLNMFDIVLSFFPPPPSPPSYFVPWGGVGEGGGCFDTQAKIILTAPSKKPIVVNICQDFEIFVNILNV